MGRWTAAPVADGYESKLDAVVAAPPIYRQTDPQVVRRLGLRPADGHDDHGAPPVDAVAAAHRLMGDGGVAERPMFYANVPSVLDPTMRAGDGDHVFSLEVLYTPYRLARRLARLDGARAVARALRHARAARLPRRRAPAGGR